MERTATKWWRRQGRRAGGAGLTARAAITAITALWMLGTHGANAANTRIDNQNGCPATYRVTLDETDCLVGTMANDLIQMRGGMIYTVKNICADLGHIVVHVEMSGEEASDHHWKLTDDNRVDHAQGGDARVDGLYCCINAADKVCHRRQTVADMDGNVRHWTGFGRLLTKMDVSTWEARYEYCRRFPDAIYCKIDPEGDAHREPGNYNCGNHYCDVGDCKWHFEQSEAFATCQGEGGDAEPSYTISATDGTSQTCTVRAQCRAGARVRPAEGEAPTYFHYVDKEVEGEVWDMNDVVNCSTVGENWNTVETRANQLDVNGDDC